MQHEEEMQLVVKVQNFLSLKRNRLCLEDGEGGFQSNFEGEQKRRKQGGKLQLDAEADCVQMSDPTPMAEEASLITPPMSP